MAAAAFLAGERGGDDKARCDQRRGGAIFIAERVDAVESAGKAGGVADDAGVGLHDGPKFAADSRQ